MLILKVLIITLIPSILVFLEPDTGAIIFYFLIALAVLIVAPIKRVWFLVLAFIILSLFIGFILLYLYKRAPFRSRQTACQGLFLPIRLWAS